MSYCYTKRVRLPDCDVGEPSEAEGPAAFIHTAPEPLVQGANCVSRIPGPLRQHARAGDEL